MKRICFISVCVTLLQSTTLFAQNILSGSVLEDNQKLTGASINVKGEKSITAISDEDGNFSIKKIKPGNYLVTCSFSGYKSWQKTIHFPDENNLEIRLTPNNNALQPVEVKAIRAGKNAPFAKTNIDKAFIEKNNLGQDVAFLLNQTPNIVVNSDAGNGIGYTSMRIRGSDNSRTNITVNGIPFNDAESQGGYFINLPDFLSSVSSIQIQRGVGTSSNGGSAFGASMNFSTHECNKIAYAELNNSFGSFNSWKNTVKIGTGLLGKHFTMDARLSRISSDGYVDRAFTKMLAGYFNAAYWGKTYSLKLSVILGKEKTYQAWNGISADHLKNNRRYNGVGIKADGSFYDNQTDNYWQNHYQLHFTKEINAKLSFNTAAFLSTGKGYYEEYRVAQPLASYGLSSTDTTDLVRRLWLKNNYWGQIFSLQYQQQKHQLALGGGWSVYNPAKHINEIIWTAINPTLFYEYINLGAYKRDANIYLKYNYSPNSHWNFFADVQYRYAHYKINGFESYPNVSVNNNWNFINPKAGISFEKNNWSGFFSYALGNKEPNRSDFEVGINQAPKSEQLHDFELNILRKNIVKGLQMGLTYYYMYYKNQLIATGQLNDVGSSIRTNKPNSFRTGVETEARYQWKKLTINYSLALSRNKIKNFTEYQPLYDADWNLLKQQTISHKNVDIIFSPSMVQYGSLQYNFLPNAAVEWMSKYVSRQYLDNTGNKNRSLNSFFVNDTRVSYNLPLQKICREARLVFQLNNLFNVKYAPNGYSYSYEYNNTPITENYYYPMAGTNFMAALNIKF